MSNPDKLLYTIGEVAEMIGESPSLIRFWEKEFPMLKPLKSEKGTRKYTKEEIAKLQFIHHLVKSKGFTLEGAKAYLKTKPNIDHQIEVLDKLKSVKKFLLELKAAINH